MKEIIKKILMEWQENSLPKQINRHFDYDQNFNDILAIIWPRRAGKTFFMFEIIKNILEKEDKTDILFINFEDYRLIELNSENLWIIIDSHYELFWKKPKYLFFDEIQNLKNYWKIIRTLKDQWYKIVISWSSSKLLIQEISTELRGRYYHLMILPFSFEELLKYKQIDIKNIEYSIKKWDLLNLFNLYVKFWWFPELLEKEEKYKIQTLENYYKTIFYKDILERFNIKSKYLFEYFMKYVTNSFSSIFSLWKIYNFIQSQKIAGSKKTLANYLHYLSESFFIIPVSKFSFSPKKSILTPKKIYLIDNWFINLANNYSENLWKKLENLVAIELFRNQKDFYYFQKNKECDFVIKEQDKISQVIQVTRELNFENRERELKWLVEAMKMFNINNWLIVTFDQKEDIVLDNFKIIVIPFYLLKLTLFKIIS